MATPGHHQSLFACVRCGFVQPEPSSTAERESVPEHNFDWDPCDRREPHGWHPWQAWDGEYMKTLWCRGVAGGVGTP